MVPKGNMTDWSPYIKLYDPLKAGSIDGTDVIPHDSAIVRALCAEYNPPDSQHVASNPKSTLFVGRLNFQTSERQLEEEFLKYGTVKSCRLIRDIATGMSRGYGFIEFKKESNAQNAWKLAHGTIFHDRQIIVEWEFARTMPGWIPRRLGGGLGGRKESGQLRFGGRDRPFKRPFILPPTEEHIPSPSFAEPSCSDSRSQNAYHHREKYKIDSRSKPSRDESFGGNVRYKNPNLEWQTQHELREHSPSYHGSGQDMREGSLSEHRSQIRRTFKDWKSDKPRFMPKHEKSRGDNYWNEEFNSAKEELMDCSSRHDERQPWSRKNYHRENRSQDYKSYKASFNLPENDHRRKRSHVPEDTFYQKSREKKEEKYEYETHKRRRRNHPSAIGRKEESLQDSHNEDSYHRTEAFRETEEKKYKRGHSSESDSSQESPSRSKHKKSKTKKRKDRSNSSSSECSPTSKSYKKHKKKKKKKKKHKRKYSSEESD